MESGPLSGADLVLLVLLALFVLGGYRRGFVHEVLDIVGLALAAALALLTYGQVGAFIDRAVGLPPHVVELVAFSGVFLVGLTVFALGSALAAWPIELTLSRLGLYRLNSVLGALPALLKGVVIVGFGLRALALSPIDGGVVGDLTTSRVSRGIQDVAAAVLPYGEGVFDQIAMQATRFVPPVTGQTEEPSAEGSELNVPRGLTTWPDPESEAIMLRLLNQERGIAGRPPLAADERLREVARAHSEDMFRLGYFAHESPTTGGPFDRLKRAGIRYLAAGENLAYAPTVEAAHRGLMESPAHRRNILGPEFRHVGIGIIQSGLWGRMFTQIFTG